MKKYVLGAIALILGVSGYLAYGKILQRGCEKAIFKNLTNQYGDCPPELKKQVEQNISEACQQLLN
jgi:hypothetical protein